MHSISVVLGFSSGWGVLSKSMNLIIFLFIDQKFLIITSGAKKSDFLKAAINGDSREPDKGRIVRLPL